MMDWAIKTSSSTYENKSMKNARVEGCVAWGLGGVLFLLVALKVIGPPGRVDPWVRYALATVEGALALGVIVGPRKIAGVVGLVFFSIAGIVAGVVPGSCGCFGAAVYLESRETRLVLAMVFIISFWLLLRCAPYGMPPTDLSRYSVEASRGATAF